MMHRREMIAVIVLGLLSIGLTFGGAWAVSEVVGIAWVDID